jgi:hypothetical protein
MILYMINEDILANENCQYLRLLASLQTLIP